MREVDTELEGFDDLLAREIPRRPYRTGSRAGWRELQPLYEYTRRHPRVVEFAEVHGDTIPKIKNPRVISRAAAIKQMEIDDFVDLVERELGDTAPATLAAAARTANPAAIRNLVDFVGRNDYILELVDGEKKTFPNYAAWDPLLQRLADDNFLGRQRRRCCVPSGRRCVRRAGSSRGCRGSRSGSRTTTTPRRGRSRARRPPARRS